MNNNKIKILNFIERLSLFFILSFIIINGILHSDSYIAIISAICGITYTFFAGKSADFFGDSFNYLQIFTKCFLHRQGD